MSTKSLQRDISNITLDDVSRPQLEIGFDFGTTSCSGVALSLDQNFGKFGKGIYRPFTVYPGQKQHADRMHSAEIPTQIYYNRDKILIGWLAKFASEDDYNSTGHHFELLKLLLDCQVAIVPERLAIQNRLLSRGFKMEQILRDYLCELFKYWKEELTNEGVPETVSIQIHCAVPAAWKDDTPTVTLKTLIIEAAGIAGLQVDRGVKAWPEPIAATFFMMEYDGEKRFRESLRADGGLCICDAGGGTVDSIVYDLSMGHDVFHEIVATKGVLHGSEFIDRNMRNEIEERLRGTGLEEQRRNQETRDCMKQFSTELKQSYQADEHDLDRTIAIWGLQKHKAKAFEKNILYITRNHMARAFEPVLEGIWKELLLPQIYEAYTKGVNVHTVALVGGFSTSKALRRFLSDRLDELASQLEIEQIKLIPADFRDFAIAEGTIRCARQAAFGIRRINKCSIGIIHEEQWDSDLPGHPRTPPPLDEVTNQYWVRDRVKYILKKGEEQKDPEVQELYEAFPVDQTKINICVPLYTHETATLDSFSSTDPKNRGLQLWHTAIFEIDISSFKSKLEVYDEYHPESWIARHCQGKKEAGSLVHKNDRTIPKTAGSTLKVPQRTLRSSSGSAQKLSVKVAENLEYEQFKRNGKAKATKTQPSIRKTTVGSSVTTVSTESICKRWHVINFSFYMHFIDGVQCEYRLKCHEAPRGRNMVKKTLDSHWTCS